MGLREQGPFSSHNRSDGAETDPAQSQVTIADAETSKTRSRSPKATRMGKDDSQPRNRYFATTRNT